MNVKQLRKYLESIDACPEAIEWVRGKNSHEAWSECVRGDWLVWVAEESGVASERIALAISQSVRPVLKYAPDGVTGGIWEYRKDLLRKCSAKDELPVIYATMYAFYAVVEYVSDSKTNPNDKSACLDALKQCADAVSQSLTYEFVMTAINKNKEAC